MCFAHNFVLVTLQKQSELNFKEWDIDNATASDFTIELVIDK